MIPLAAGEDPEHMTHAWSAQLGRDTFEGRTLEQIMLDYHIPVRTGMTGILRVGRGLGLVCRGRQE